MSAGPTKADGGDPDGPAMAIAPRDESQGDPAEIVGQMMDDAFAPNTLLTYYGYHLTNGGDGGCNVWTVWTSTDRQIETLNLSAFRAASEVLDVLDEIVAVDPDDAADWRRR